MCDNLSFQVNAYTSMKIIVHQVKENQFSSSEKDDLGTKKLNSVALLVCILVFPDFIIKKGTTYYLKNDIISTKGGAQCRRNN